MRDRSRANFVAPHFLTRERLGSGWILCRYSGKSRRSGGPLRQRRAHIDKTHSRLGLSGYNPNRRSMRLKRGGHPGAVELSSSRA